MTPSTFDLLAAVRKLVNAGIERSQAEAIAEELRTAAGADRAELVTKAEFYRALWIQGAGIVAILAAIRFIPV